MSDNWIDLGVVEDAVFEHNTAWFDGKEYTVVMSSRIELWPKQTTEHGQSYADYIAERSKHQHVRSLIVNGVRVQL